MQDKLKNINESLECIEKSFYDIAYLRNILLEVTSRCNLNCIQCAHKNIKRPQRDMDFDLYRKIIDDAAINFPKVHIWLAVYGEPLLIGHKIYDMISYAKKYNFVTHMNTNGVLLDDEMCACLAEAGLDNITIAVDGFSTEVYENIRRGAKRDKVYENVLRLRDLINKTQPSNKRMHIEVQLIEMDENMGEIEEYKKYWRMQGIAVRIRGRMTWAGNISIGNNINRDKDRIACGYTFSQLCTLNDGTVVSCANDVYVENVLGDLNNQTLSEIWESKQKNFTNLHFNHHFEKLPLYCRNCYDWQVIGTVDYDENGLFLEKTYE